MKSTWAKYAISFCGGFFLAAIVYEEWVMPNAVVINAERIELQHITSDFNKKQRAELETFLRHLQETE